MRLVPLALAVLAACADPGLARAHSAPVRSGPFTLELLGASGAVLPTFQHRGRTYVLGALGDRYQVRVRNGSARRAEIVVSVDGRDVVDGRPAALGKRGYVVAPHGEVVVDGFRLSDASVAAFRFSSVRDSYAGRMGDARDVGVIGAAVFLERPVPHRALADSQVRRGEAPAPEASAGAPADTSASAAPARPPEAAEKHSGRKAAPQDRPGLGTEFGEERESRVTEVAFERAEGAPAGMLSLRYDDRAGLLALGIDVDGRMARRDERWLRETAEPFRGSGFAAPPPGWNGR
jgi:hypothetical protein